VIFSYESLSENQLAHVLKADGTLEGWEKTVDEEPLDNDQIEAIKQEITDLTAYRELAAGIKENAKGKALIIALEKAFAEADRLGAQQKAVIFTRPSTLQKTGTCSPE
jgi:hypothetical protein